VSKPDDCPTDLPGPTLVRLATPEGTTYCMDRTEVTQKHYASFLAAVEATPAIKDDVKGQPAFCANGFELLARNAEGTDDSIPYCPGSLFDPGKTGDHPVVCVGPCAARAYCQWAGKELCGAPLGGASDMGSAISPAQSAWYNACTNGGQTKVAVEGGVSSGKCTVSGPQGAPHRSVEADAACHSDVEPFSQIVNLGGGVVEWEDSCDASGCLTRGARIVGSATTEEESCDDVGVRGGAIEYVGLRCCKPLAQR
jgi:formylglycine-generating enzyme required for sulfatase activity